MSEHKDLVEATQLDWDKFNNDNPDNPERTEWTFAVDIKAAKFIVTVMAKDYEYAYQDADMKVADLLTPLGDDSPEELQYYYELEHIPDEA